MKVDISKTPGGKAKVIRHYDSIDEFTQYIENTPLNNLFRWKTLRSSATDYASWTGTKDFPEAMDLLKHGWEDKAKEIEKALQIKLKEMAPRTVNRAQYDVIGFQTSVPRTLQGIPTNMINQKKVVQKQKIATVVKNICYWGSTSAEQIVEYSVKALQIVKMLEDKGTRINLDIISPSRTSNGEIHIIRVRIKSANERLNVSKVAFPLANPSMLRRMEFRHLEVCQEITDSEWTRGYGQAIQGKQTVKQYLNKGELYLDSIINDVDTAMAEMLVD